MQPHEGNGEKKSMHMSIVQSGCMTIVCVWARVLTHTCDRVLGKPKSHSSARQTVVAVCGYCIFFAWIPVNTPRPALPACLPVTATILPSAASFMLQPESWRRPHKEIKRGLRLADTLWPITHLFFFFVCVCEERRGGRVGWHLVLAGKNWVGPWGRILVERVKV